MGKELSAGDVERKTSEYLSEAIASGKVLDVELVRSCFDKSINELGLDKRPSDDLRVQDLYDLLQNNSKIFSGVDIQIMNRKIFEVIYTK